MDRYGALPKISPSLTLASILPSAVATSVMPCLSGELDKTAWTQDSSAVAVPTLSRLQADGPHSLMGIKPGLTDATVGLLQGLRTQYMDKYHFEMDKGKRAPREDLSAYSAEEQVARRKMRARTYSRNARRRHRQLKDEMADDVEEMHIWEVMVQLAPHIILVFSSDIHCRVLYANDAVTKTLCIAPERLIGTSLWAIVHPDDKEKLAAVITAMVLTKLSPEDRIHVRVRTAFDEYFALFDTGLRYGLQGIQCTMWPQPTGGKQ